MQYRHFIGAVLMSACWVMLSLWLHTRSCFFSMINYRAEGTTVANNYIAEDYLTKTVAYHQSHPAFARRPLTTQLVKGLAASTTLGLGQSFTAINFFLLFLGGPLLYYLALLKLRSEWAALWSLILFYSTFSILFAFFPSIYTYDEPLQYALLFLALIFWEKEKYGFFVTCFALALICRESALLLLPGMALYVAAPPLGRGIFFFRKAYTTRLAYLTLPVLIYGLYLFAWYRFGDWMGEGAEQEASRWALVYYNFQNGQFAIESFCSMLLGWGLPTFVLFFLWKRMDFSKDEIAWVKAFCLSLILNTFLVFIATKARETRLFALPLILLWPLAGGQLIRLHHYWRSQTIAKGKDRIRFLVLLVISLFLLLMIVLHLYRPTGLDASQNLHKPYLFSFLSLLTTATLFHLWPKVNADKDYSPPNQDV